MVVAAAVAWAVVVVVLGLGDAPAFVGGLVAGGIGNTVALSVSREA